MKAAKHLSDLNISLGQARAFIKSHLSTPDFLLEVFKQYDVTEDMAAEIMGTSRGHIVRYFAQNGIDSSVLDKLSTDDEDSGFGSDADELTVNSMFEDVEIDEMESDLYQIELIAGSEYTFTVTSDELTAPRLVLFNDEGERIGSDYQIFGESGGSAPFDFTASESGTFYLEVSDLIDETTGEYDISFVVADDFTADTDTSGQIEFDINDVGSASGTLEAPGDVDWFGVTLEASTAYLISLASDDLTTPQLAIYDTDGAPVPEDTAEINEDGNLIFTSDLGGDYYIEVSDSGEEATGIYLVGVEAIV